MSTQLSPPPPAPMMGPMMPLVRVIHEDLKSLRDHWLLFVVLGSVLALVGVAALAYSTLFTFATAMVYGYFLVLGGVLFIGGAFFTREWGGFFLSLLAGVLHLAAGFIIINHPAEAVILYTLLLAVFFFVEGLFRIVTALVSRFQHWSFVLLGGIVTMLLGFMIWQQWPISGLWVVGTFIGINLIVNGVSYIGLGLNARKLPA